MRNTEKVSQLFGVIEPEKMSESQHHEHFEGETTALAKLLVKDGEKPDKFLRPHGMSSGLMVFAFSWRIIPKAIKIKTLWKSWNYQFHCIHMDFTQAIAIFISSELASSVVHTLMTVAPGLQTSINVSNSSPPILIVTMIPFGGM